MTVEFWDTDLAVVYGPIDEELEGTCSADRYGVTLEEELHGEPLDVALAQEEPDLVTPDPVSDDQWALIDETDDFAAPGGRRTDRSPEELALHLVEP